MENSIDIFLFLCYNMLTEYLFLGVIVMKKIAALVLSGLMILSLGVASFAAQGDSAEDPGKLVIIDAKDKDGADIKDQVKVVENDESKRAKEDASQKVLSDVLGKDYKASLAVDAAYDLDYTGSNFPLSVTFEYKSAKSGDTLYVLQKTADGWKRLDATVANGKITVAFASADPFVIVRDTASSSSDSPKTGYNSALIATVALISLAGAAYAIKRAVAAHN